MSLLRRLLFQLVILTSLSSASGQPLTLISWNLKDLGVTKDDTEIRFIAQTIRHADLVAIQEVVVNPAGPQAVARLVMELNTMGAAWDYVVSDPTSSSAYKTERYAFVWKKSRLKIIGRPWLEKQFQLEIDREPYFATFDFNGKKFTLVNFHAITKSKHPETEVKYLRFLPEEYPGLKLIFVGDFNLPQSHTVFNPLKKMGYVPALLNQRTTLRQECLSDGCLASEFDNIFYFKPHLNVIETGVIHFYQQFETLQEAKAISDHVPVYIKFIIK